MAVKSSTAPPERINITYETKVDGAQKRVELPFRLAVLSDFTGRPDSTRVEDRPVHTVSKEEFDNVMSSFDLELNFAVRNVASDDPDNRIPVNFKIRNMKHFEPDYVVEQVPELQKLIRLREALLAVKGPTGNAPDFREAIMKLIKDEDSRQRLMKELGLEAKSGPQSNKSKGEG
jgi:type VI secretion system protein ImpB